MERTDADALHGVGLAHDARHGARQFGLAAFHFDDDARIAVPPEHERQRRHAQTLAAKRMPTVALELITGIDARQLVDGQIVDRAATVGRAIERLVMNEDRHTIGRELDVDLEAVGAEGQAVVERRHGVLRGEPRATAVRKHQGTRRLEHGHAHPIMFAWVGTNPKADEAYTRGVRMLETLGAVAVVVLPRRHWDRFDALPLHYMAPVSGMLTVVAGAALGIRGFFAYLARMSNSSAASILDVSQMQVDGRLPETAAVSAVPAAIWMVAPIAFAFFTPIGLFAVYLVASGWFRVVSWWIASPHGDPLLTGIDTLLHRRRVSAAARSKQRERLAAEGAEEPDRRYPGDWAGVPDTDFVIVAARQKPDWTAGTFVITPDGWFTLGQPFDRPMPQGIRTIYPLTALATMAVMRKGVAYDLPPLRPHPPQGRKPELNR